MKEHWGIMLILIAAFLLRWYMITVDPFLHEWDEKYHALVARNMMFDPFFPSIYRVALLPYDPGAWCCNHVWLHKQPLFLWQMALSMRLFGVSEWSMRLPSLLMGTLSVLLTYRISLLIAKQKLAALIAALIVCFSCYQLNLISGREGMDHNDVAFNFYVLASFWAAAEYLQTKAWKWALWIGIFAGCAILNKWLTGLLVFLPLGVLLLIDTFAPIKQRRGMTWPHFLLALFVCVLVFAPWQWYVWTHFPREAAIEYELNAQHIFKVLEGHNGSYGYYLSHFNQYFGDIIELFVVPAMLYFLWARKFDPIHKWLLVLPVIAVYVFFSFIVQTKVTGFFFVVYPFIVILSGFMLNDLLSLAGKWKPWLVVPLLAGLGFWSLNLQKITDYTADKNYREAKYENTLVYKQLPRLMPAGVKVLMNVNDFEHADIMFYNPEIIAYMGVVNEEEFRSLATRRIPIAVFSERERHYLPQYIKDYPYLHLINVHLR
jgi:4-amino-4-deoxy-L-arabinose transferase